MPAQMPTAYLAKPPVPVSQLPVGETGYILFVEVVVDASDHSVYLLASAKLRGDNFNTVEIRHDSDGYRLILRDATLYFTLQRIKADTDLIPIVEVIERLTPNRLDRIEDTLQETSETLNQLRDGSRATESASKPPDEPSAPMPLSRIRPPRRFLADLKVEETGYLDFTEVRVDEKTGAVYLSRTGSLNSEPGLLTVGVTRRADGYHLSLHNPRIQFTRDTIHDYSTLVAVASIEETGLGKDYRSDTAAKNPPSFSRSLWGQFWSMAKVLLAICLWGGFVIWICYPNVIAISLSLSASMLVALLLQAAWSDYKWKQRDWSRNQLPK